MKELQQEYEDLFKREEKIDEELISLLKNQNLNQAKFNSLQAIMPKIQLIHNDSTNLSNMINFTTNLADNVSSKVRVLDLAKGRVTCCIKRITDILDLKACTDGVTEALSEEDYETAANHIHRYLSLDKDSLKLKTNNSLYNKINSADKDLNYYNADFYYLENSFNLLQESKLRLQKIVNEKYNQALKEDDVPQLERFFKIFPLIGQSENGLNKFCSYLCLQITQAANKNYATIDLTQKSDERWNVMFADALILLFEKVARVIEAYQPVIENYYGRGNMKLFIEHIQKECDLQACKILDKFKEIRTLKVLFNKVLKSQNLNWSTAPTNSNHTNTINLHNSTLANNEKSGEILDPRLLDELLTEITLISSRTELYKSFLMKIIINDLNTDSKHLNSVFTPELRMSSEEEAIEKKKKIEEAESFIKNCNLNFHIQELIGQYSILENYFMNENINKAIQMDTIMNESQTSSVVDEVFFILKKCIKRCLFSDNVDGCCAMFNNCTSVLDSSYREYFHSQLKNGFINRFTDFAQAYSAIQRRFHQNEQQLEKEKIKFIVALNNIEESIEFITELKKSFEEDISKLFGNESKSSKEKLNSCLSDLGSVSLRLKQLIEFGFNQLTINDIRPRINQWMENYQSINHKITEEDFNQGANNDDFLHILIKNIDQMLIVYKEKFSLKNRDLLIGNLANEIVTCLEKSIYKCSFTKYGGMKVDKEIRILINYLATLTSWSIREKFSRLSQISIILSLDSIEELFEYWNSSLTITWRLTPNEIRQILMLRTEFKTIEIKSLNL